MIMKPSLELRCLPLQFSFRRSGNNFSEQPIFLQIALNLQARTRLKSSLLKFVNYSHYFSETIIENARSAGKCLIGQLLVPNVQRYGLCQRHLSRGCVHQIPFQHVKIL
jgi:hypothetical protein